MPGVGMFGPGAGERGFTLIELVLVIVIAGVALFPIAMMFASATANSPQPELVTQAVFLAQDRMENVLGDFHAPSRGYPYISTSNYPAETAISGFPGFTRSVFVSADSTFDGVTFKEVTVTVANAAIVPVHINSWVVQ